MLNTSEQNLIQRIRRGDDSAWRLLIADYERRLSAFVVTRLQDRTLAEDVVQETFLGFLTSLPNYDERTPLESFLFAIAAHKLTDALRRQGRRPMLTGRINEDVQGGDPSGRRVRGASSMARHREQEKREETLISSCLQDLISGWKQRGEWERLKCAELLLVKGWPNKEVASKLGISEQSVANHKQFILGKLKNAANDVRV